MTRTRCEYETPHGQCSRRASMWVDWQQDPDGSIEDRRVCVQHLGSMRREASHLAGIVHRPQWRVVAFGRTVGSDRFVATFAIDGRYVESPS